KIPLEKMAQLLKTSIDTIRRVEQGEKHIPNSWLPKLAANFKIDPHWISTGIRPTGAGHSI
ncbi:MAG TPA: hypothetical protein VK186_18675, partial [Candidatus Deferrimicrobium sp.]|nr:hypothetical protein [Candidatus Deferrimicrobium sp.]